VWSRLLCAANSLLLWRLLEFVVALGVVSLALEKSRRSEAMLLITGSAPGWRDMAIHASSWSNGTGVKKVL
jgi:hypothetical protein